MKVAVTGGTGFVGSHTVAELIKRGHEVKLLVRSPDRVRRALDPLGVGEVETKAGDVTDEQAVASLLEGCDAVIHCASIYSLDPSAARVIKETNVRGTDAVLGTAQRLGLDPIVHVSSYVAFLGKPEITVHPESEPTQPKPVYAASKAESERVARRCQQSGAPVVITYPGMVWGPHDPYFGDTAIVARHMLSNYLIMMPNGRFPITDVRDVARLHAAVMEKGQGARRYFCTAHNTPVKKLYRELSAITGRSLPCLTIPGWMMLPSLVPLNALEGLLGFRTPWTYQGAYSVATAPQVDDSKTRSELGIEPKPLTDTLTDTIRWLAEVGYISKRLAGKAA